MLQTLRYQFTRSVPVQVGRSGARARRGNFAGGGVTPLMRRSSAPGGDERLGRTATHFRLLGANLSAVHFRGWAIQVGLTELGWPEPGIHKPRTVRVVYGGSQVRPVVYGFRARGLKPRRPGNDSGENHPTVSA